METTLSPVFLSYDMPPNLIVTSYRAIDPNCRNAFSWTKQYPTPKGYVSTTDFNPARSYILTKTSPDKIVDGWTCDGQWNWEDAPHRVRERLTKRMVEQYLGYVKKVQKVGSSWVLEGPHEVDSNDGSVSRLWLCADFSYCQLRGKDGVEVSISRKVQSSLSIWEEREKGLLTQDSKYLRVKVAISDTRIVWIVKNLSVGLLTHLILLHGMVLISQSGNIGIKMVHNTQMKKWEGFQLLK